MTRTTLKLLKPVDRNAPPKTSTSRARRSPHGTPRSPQGTPRSSDAPSAPVKPARTNLPPPPAAHEENAKLPRLSKRMSELGLCSRREADEWIENGWVKVDGQVVSTLGVRVSPSARIEIDPAAARHQSELVTILLNKPVGYVSGQPEDGHEPAIVLIRPENRWPADPSPIRFKPSHLRGLAPAGRLDIDSTGLLVFTQDGRVARHLIGQDSDVEKEYLVRVEGTLSDEGMKRLQHGLELDGVKLKPARVSWQNEHQLRFVLREGRKRQIRRMCEQVGLRVIGLKRVRSGSVPLGPLPEGSWRYLRRDEKF
jgi:23S rRNA pseudouridine2604 synthase